MCYCCRVCLFIFCCGWCCEDFCFFNIESERSEMASVAPPTTPKPPEELEMMSMKRMENISAQDLVSTYTPSSTESSASFFSLATQHLTESVTLEEMVDESSEDEKEQPVRIAYPETRFIRPLSLPNLTDYKKWFENDQITVVGKIERL